MPEASSRDRDKRERRTVRVRLVPMSETDYAEFLDWSIADYAEAQIRAEAWTAEDARQLSEDVFRRLLPDGLSTPKQHLCTIVDEALGEGVGFLWYGPREEESGQYVVLYQFVILEPYRRQGYGTVALRALDDQVRELGMDRVVLHVFGHNEAARALYRKAGYVERNVTMVRRLGG
jgi:RimJ/RimL family protein N-acetyltransferase